MDDMKQLIKYYWTEYVRFIFMPRYWIMNYPYSEEVDILLRDYMELYEFILINKYEAKLGNLVLWIENYPHASFTIRNEFWLGNLRPSRSTIYKLHEKLTKELDNNLFQRKRVEELLKEALN